MHPRIAPGKPNLKSAEAENRLELYLVEVFNMYYYLKKR